MPIELYTDGSSLHNPGPSGLAYLVRAWEMKDGNDVPEPSITEYSEGYRLSTNNRMEILAVVRGLKFILDDVPSGKFQGAAQINVFSDSEYVCNAVNQHWINKWQQNNWMTSGFQGRQPKPVKNKDLWTMIIELQEQAKQCGVSLSFHHVKGHDGDEFNERCDKMAVDASNGTNHLIDEVYEKTTEVKNKNDYPRY